MLESVYRFLDYYTVVDTGSIDNTKQTISNFFKDKNIPGQILDHPFVDFADARNFAMDAARGKTTHMLWIDADEFILFHPPYTRETFPYGDFKQNTLGRMEAAVVRFRGRNEDGTFKSDNTRVNFIQLQDRFRWSGPVHEVIGCDGGPGIVNDFRACKKFVGVGESKGFHMESKFDGGSVKFETKKKKMIARAQLLEEYVKLPGNYMSRWLFHIASSYQLAEEYKLALPWFEERAKFRDDQADVGETYFSQFAVALIKEMYMDDFQLSIEDIIEAYEKCEEVTPDRAEHYYNLVTLYQKQGDLQNALKLARKTYYSFHGRKITGVGASSALYDWGTAYRFVELAFLTKQPPLEIHCALKRLMDRLEGPGDPVPQVIPEKVFGFAAQFYVGFDKFPNGVCVNIGGV